MYSYRFEIANNDPVTGGDLGVGVNSIYILCASCLPFERKGQARGLSGPSFHVVMKHSNASHIATCAGHREAD
jgi:hypothetical protein